MTLVTLRPIAAAHAADVQRLAADPAVTATTNLPEPYPEDGAAAWIAHVVPRHAAGQEYVFAMFAEGVDASREPRGVLVGVCGLIVAEPSTQASTQTERSAEMGYWLGRAYWGRGYATDACLALTSLAFTQTAIAAIDAYPLADNHASRRVLEKAGAALVGIVPNRYPKWSPDRLLAHYRLTRADVHNRET